MGEQRAAIAWLLLLILGLLLGLVILAAALGVLRHVRRQRGNNRSRKSAEDQVASDDDSGDT
jgi:hypothetical protein